MKTLIKYVVGNDIAKDKFDACLMSVDVELNYKVISTRKFSNNIKGFKELQLWLKKNCKENVPVQILMEATGVYHEKLAIWLTDQEHQVFVVLPNKARKFMQALGLKSKNDKIDAQGLALMCAQHKFDLWQPIAKYFYELRLLTRHYQITQEARTIFLNQQHALQHSGYSSKMVSKQLEKTISLFKKQVKEGKQNIIEYINSNDDVKRKVSQICKIKGVDVLTVATIIAETNGFELFKNIRQLVSYAGYDVIENQSGKHVGKTKISKKGNSRIRRILHMPALNVVRFEEPSFVNLYKRVFNNSKIKMKAYVAVQKKLLETIYTLWKKDQAYQKYFTQDATSGNDESRVLFPFLKQEKKNNGIKKVVPPIGSTTQDEHRYKESSEVLFP
jgi:transposase